MVSHLGAARQHILSWQQGACVHVQSVVLQPAAERCNIRHSWTRHLEASSVMGVLKGMHADWGGTAAAGVSNGVGMIGFRKAYSIRLLQL